MAASAVSFQFKGLRIFKWNEKLSKKNFPYDHQGLFLFTVHKNKKKISSREYKVVTFDCHDLLAQWPQSLKDIVRRALQDAWYFMSALTAESLSIEISDYTSSCYYLTQDTLLGLFHHSPCLVFAVELLVVEQVGGGPQKFETDLNLTSPAPSMPLMDIGTCITRDQTVLALYCSRLNEGYFSYNAHDHVEGPVFDDDDDDNDDEFMYLHDTDFSDIYLEEGDVGLSMENDIVQEEKEIAEVAEVLRSWMGVERSNPVEPVVEGLPVGLILVVPKLEIVMEAAKLLSVRESLKGDIDECPVCLNRFADDESMKRVIIRTKCGHVFHRECIYKWLRDLLGWSCPMCRSCCITPV